MVSIIIAYDKFLFLVKIEVNMCNKLLLQNQNANLKKNIDAIRDFILKSNLDDSKNYIKIYRLVH